MGYTHYWDHPAINEEAWAEFIAEVKELIKRSPVPLAGWDGTGTPEVNEDEVRLNGRTPEDCETFELTPERTDFAFCKTEYLEYDVMVCAILLTAHRMLPRFDIQSDGTWDDWLLARQFLDWPDNDRPEHIRA